MDREGISPEARRALFQEEYTQSLILAHAASMERNGASFTEQQLGAAGHPQKPVCGAGSFVMVG